MRRANDCCAPPLRPHPPPTRLTPRACVLFCRAAACRVSRGAVQAARHSPAPPPRRKGSGRVERAGHRRAGVGGARAGAGGPPLPAPLPCGGAPPPRLSPGCAGGGGICAGAAVGCRRARAAPLVHDLPLGCDAQGQSGSSRGRAAGRLCVCCAATPTHPPTTPSLTPPAHAHQPSLALRTTMPSSSLACWICTLPLATWLTCRLCV